MIDEVNSVVVVLFLFGKGKSTEYGQAISGISSYKSRGKVLRTHRSKKSMTQMMRRPKGR
jgi:hypothetical protein